MLGVRVVRMLDYAEGELDRADFDKLVGRIVEPIRMHRPEVILTFGPDGVTGDTDHVIVSRAVRAAYDRAAQPLAYEDNIDEDQVAWRAAKLYELVVPPSTLAGLGERAPSELWIRPRADARLSSSATLRSSSWPRSAATCRRRARPAHFTTGTPDARASFLGTEHYRLAASALSAPTDGEASLFDGLS